MIPIHLPCWMAWGAHRFSRTSCSVSRRLGLQTQIAQLSAVQILRPQPTGSVTDLWWSVYYFWVSLQLIAVDCCESQVSHNSRVYSQCGSVCLVQGLGLLPVQAKWSKWSLNVLLGNSLNDVDWWSLDCGTSSSCFEFAAWTLFVEPVAFSSC